MTNPTAESLPITIRDVTKSYGQVYALDNVSLDVDSGEFLTLLGPSGSGKTTLLMVLAGFTRPDQGSLLFGDTDITRKPPHLRNVGMVFQNYALFPHMSVAGNVGYPLRLRGINKSDTEHRIEQALETVQLGGYGTRRIHQLSGGQKQRVALARAIVFEPRILLMDEPLSALDKKLRDRMQIELRQLHEKMGMTTVYVTHDQKEALTMSDRIAVINHGKVMQLDSPVRIYDQPANRFVADFIGESTFLPVDCTNTDVTYNGVPLSTSTPPLSAGRQLVLIRPERVRIVTDDVDPATNRFPGTVTDVVYQGDSYLLYVTLTDGTEVSARGVIRRDTLAQLPEAGRPVTLGLHVEDTVLIAAED